jgi:hypothetical protein
MADPDRPPGGTEAPGEVQRRGDVHAGQALVALGIRRLEVQHHQIDQAELVVCEPAAVPSRTCASSGIPDVLRDAGGILAVPPRVSREHGALDPKIAG